MRLERGEVRGQVLPCSQLVRINLQELQTADQPERIKCMDNVFWLSYHHLHREEEAGHGDVGGVPWDQVEEEGGQDAVLGAHCQYLPISGNALCSDKASYATRKLNVSKQEIFGVKHLQCLIGPCLHVAKAWTGRGRVVTLKISINWLSERKQSKHKAQ